jgi:ABC-type uncharacterized transport system permease subunit
VGVFNCLALIEILSAATHFIKRLVPADFIFFEMSRLAFLPVTAWPRKVGVALLIILPALFLIVVPVAISVRGEMWLLPYFLVGSGTCWLLFLFVFLHGLKSFYGMGGECEYCTHRRLSGKFCSAGR